MHIIQLPGVLGVLGDFTHSDNSRLRWLSTVRLTRSAHVCKGLIPLYEYHTLQGCSGASLRAINPAIRAVGERSEVGNQHFLLQRGLPWLKLALDDRLMRLRFPPPICRKRRVNHPIQ